jgi:cyanophycinase
MDGVMSGLRALCPATVVALSMATCCAAAQDAESPVSIGPAKGSLIIAGGGPLKRSIMDRFIQLAGGPEAPIVLVPTAGSSPNYSEAWSGCKMFHELGARNLIILHTRDRNEADSEEFVKPLLQAKGVWFGGGRQWRLVDSYLDTRTERAFQAVLDRGGVIGGSSAGATIQGDYLVRGAREGNQIMMAPGYEKGFGYLKNCAVDQHLLARKREKDLVSVVRRHPQLLGIGIDEGTAIVVQKDEFEVVGRSKVAIYDPRRAVPAGKAMYYFLGPGERFDLRHRRKIATGIDGTGQ